MINKEKLLIDSIRQDAIDFKEDKKYKDRYEEYENMKQTLSDNLYSKNSHFIYELIQNAEDNLYNVSVIPTLKFIVSKEGILTQNNESGFNESNIRSICKFSTSSKKGQKELGYIGEKGLGFKSVFAITDKPSIYSNGYLFYFKAGEYTIPYWFSDEEIDLCPKEFSQKNTTNIFLPFKNDFQYRDDISNKIKDIEPIILLFLSKLRSLQILENQKHLINVERITSKSFTNFDETLLLFNNNEEIYYTTKKIVSKPVDLIEPKRENVVKREIVLAFPALDNKLKEDRIFSFLPTEMKTGLPFLIQSDFVLIGNRENIIEENKWNLWLLDEIVDFFVSEFHNLKLSNKHNYLRYLEAKKSSHPFIDKYYKKILTKLNKEKLFLTNTGDFVKPDRICILEDYDFMIEYLSDITYNNVKNKKLSYLDPSFHIPKHLIESWNIVIVDKNKFLNIISQTSDHFSSAFKNNNILFDNLISYIGSDYNNKGTLSGIPIIPIEENGEIVFYNKNQLKGLQIFYSLDSEGVLNDVFDDMKIISKKYRKTLEKITFYNSVFEIRQPDIIQILKSLDKNKKILENDGNNIKLLTFIKNNWKGENQSEIIKLIKENYLFLTKNNQFIKHTKSENYNIEKRKYETIFESKIYISSEYLEEKININAIVNKYCVRKFSVDFDFISERYLESDKVTSKKDLKTLKHEWKEFFENLQIDDSLKLISQTLEMYALDSQGYIRSTSASFKNIPFIAAAFFDLYNKIYKNSNFKFDELTKQDSIFLIQKIYGLSNLDNSIHYFHVTGFYRGFRYDRAKTPWVDTIKDEFSVYIKDSKVLIKDTFLKVDKELTAFFPKLPDSYKKEINIKNLTAIFNLLESPDLDDVIELIRNRKILDFKIIEHLFKYIHNNFEDDKISLGVIPILNNNQEIEYVKKEKLIWENGKALKLLNLSDSYNSDFKQFFIVQVGIQEKPSISQYLEYLGTDKKPTNYEQIFNQFVIYLEELIGENEAPVISNKKIFHVNDYSYSSDEIIFNDENIESNAIPNLFSVQKKILSPFEKIADFYNIKRLSEFARNTHVSNVIKDTEIQVVYRKLLNFIWDYIYSKSSKKFNDLKENKEFILKTKNVINGAKANVVLKIEVNGKFIDITKNVYLKDDFIYVSEIIPRKKIPTELSKFIGELVDVEFEKIERFYDKVHKYKEDEEYSYYRDEEINTPDGDDSFDVVFKNLKQKEENSNENESIGKQPAASKPIYKDNKFSDEAEFETNEGFYENNEDTLDETTHSLEEINNIVNQIDDNDIFGSQQSKPNLKNAILNTSRSIDKTESLIDPEIVKDEKEYIQKAQEQLDKNLKKSHKNNQRYTSSYKVKIGKNETRDFLKDQYKGHCQICGFTFDLKENGGKYFETFDWLSENISKQRSNLIEAGNSLCLCATCHSIMKYGDFHPNFMFELQEIGDLSRLTFDDFTELVQSKTSIEEAPEAFEFIEMDMHKASIRLLTKKQYIFYTEEHFLHLFNMMTMSENQNEMNDG